MGDVLKPIKIQTITKEGECVVTIALDINIHLDGDQLKITTNTKEEPKEEKKDSSSWTLPDFNSFGKVKFGKKIEE